MNAARAAGEAEPVYRRIRDRIVQGELAPGARLVEATLADLLGTSRTPVREALRRLEADGLVVIHRNRGAAVRRLAPAEIDDLYELRMRLEAYAAELAANRADDDDRVALRGAADDFDRAVAARIEAADDDAASLQDLSSANRAFHDGIVVAARHPRLAAVLAGTVDVPLVFRSLRTFHAEELQRSAMFHHLIVDAVERHAADRAGRLMAEHVAQGRDALRIDA